MHAQVNEKLEKIRDISSWPSELAYLELIYQLVACGELTTTQNLSSSFKKSIVPEDLCHCHTKRRIDGQGPDNPSLGMTLTIEY